MKDTDTKVMDAVKEIGLLFLATESTNKEMEESESSVKKEILKEELAKSNEAIENKIRNFISEFPDCDVFDILSSLGMSDVPDKDVYFSGFFKIMVEMSIMTTHFLKRELDKMEKDNPEYHLVKFMVSYGEKTTGHIDELKSSFMGLLDF